MTELYGLIQFEIFQEKLPAWLPVNRLHLTLDIH